MLRHASRCALRAACRAELAGSSFAAKAPSVCHASLTPVASVQCCSSLLLVPSGRNQQHPWSIETPATQRWSTGLAQQDEPVEEERLQDEHVDQKAAKSRDADTFDKGNIAPDPSMQSDKMPDPKKQEHGDAEYWLMQPVYSKEYTESVKPRHIPAEKVRQKLANLAVFIARSFFDRITSYDLHSMNEKKWLRRIIFLETVAGVPGMVGGMLRHMRSLRSMKQDNGWIHTLLEEAENERMHLLTFLQLRQPGMFFRGMVLLSQGMFFNAYFIAYVMSPKLCHSFVGYLEEEAVKTYTHVISDMDKGRLPEWSTKKVPDIARDYWKLGEDATMRDLILSVRADEACHCHVNHTFSELGPNEKNPFAIGTHVVPTA